MWIGTARSPVSPTARCPADMMKYLDLDETSTAAMNALVSQAPDGRVRNLKPLW